MNSTMNNMNRCIGTQSKMIYGCHPNFRMLDPQTQVVPNQVHQASNPHQLPTQQITKINTATKSDQQQTNKDASDNQNISFSQGDQPPPSQLPPPAGANQDKRSTVLFSGLKQKASFSMPLISAFSPFLDLNKMLGVSPSDIDKYSRVVFPVCFVSISNF